MKKFGLIGYPISHSQSPVLFKKNFPDPELTYDLIETPDFEEAFKRFKQNYDAINVTAPFKENACRAADDCSLECRIAGASNLLINDRGTVHAHNTDIIGVIEPLEKALVSKYGKDWKEKDLKGMVIGIGGAGKAAVLALLKMGIETCMCNRSQSKPEALIQRLKESGTCIPKNILQKDLVSKVKEYDIIVYCLPVAIPELDEIDFADKVILEANYKDPSIHEDRIKETTLYIHGREWLRSQAVETWKLFGLI